MSRIDMKNAVRSTSLALLMCSGLAACCTAIPHNDALMKPLPPASLGSSRSARQLLRGAFGDREASLQAVVDVNPQRITVVGLTAMGNRVFSVSYDGSSLKSDTSPLAPKQLQPERVLVDMQLVLWPYAALQQALDGSHWQLSEPAERTRRLRRDGKLIAEIHYADTDAWRGRAWLSNFEYGYALAIESQPLQ